jgi:hypothetical protein
VSERAVIGYHGHCFDGMCSAALLTHLIAEVEPKALSVAYAGLDHQPGGSHVPEAVLAGVINAVVDFRYTTSPKLGWWFDHHHSGLHAGEERAHFEQDTGGRKFFDPSYGSCTKLIADIAASRFNVSMDRFDDTVAWADTIDAARFADAHAALDLSQPALKLMTVVEAHGDNAFMAPRIAALAAGASLSELASEGAVQRLFLPLQDAHVRTTALIRSAARVRGDVVYFDLVGHAGERYNKFIPYALYPELRYTVAVTAGRSRSKVSVGSNPWSLRPRQHNIADLCTKYGGGGHPAVGAISLPPADVERARTIASEIIDALNGA